MMKWFNWIHPDRRRLQPYGHGNRVDDILMVRNMTHRKAIVYAGANATKYIREHRRKI
jgi:hypothetical protein